MSDIATATAPTETTTTTTTPTPPKDTCKKRPVIVSLPPKKQQQQHHHPSENHSWSEGTVPGPEPPCHFCAAHHHHHSRSHNTEIIEPVSTLFLHQKPSATNKMEPSLSSCSSSVESASPTMEDELPTQQQHDDSEEVTKKPLPHPFAVLQHHGNLYDDPAVVHVIDHSRHHRHHAASGTNHQSPPSQHQQFLRMPGGDAEVGGATTGGGASMTHGVGGGECPCRYQHHYCNHASPVVDHSVWDKLANKIDQLVETRVQAMQQQQHKHECSPWKQDEVRLEDLELATARLDRRLIALENQVTAAWRSHPHTNNHLPTQSSNSSSSHPTRNDDDATTRSHQLQYECQSLYGRLTEEQRKTKHLEQQHVEFHKRQTEDMLKMEKLQQQVNALKAELRQYKNHPQGKRAPPQPRRPGPPMHHPSAPAATTHHRLPTPGSSPSSTGLRMHKQQQRPKQPPCQDEDGSVREEDGYLVFNTNINGELIHCKVKIPTSAASSPTMQHHRPHHYSKPMSDFPLALVSPPITRAGTPTTTMRVDKMMMIPPPLSKHKKGITTTTTSGLNPNAPEWKNGTWK
ncbi:hypothetical protein K492DRAFT_206966 [Lichtheimia hyalospora FSU 10163]|nr:hypothetical protein K492DRAFT_206966 [Lichtheimia hyalospora FSU 10163]